MGLCRVGWAMVLGLAAGSVASAADVPLIRKAPPLAPAFDWSGFYAGGHVGYGRGSTRSVLSEPASPDGVSTFGSLYGGLQAGYNVVFPSGYFVGVEGDISFPEFFEDGAMWQRPTVTRRKSTPMGRSQTPRSCGAPNRIFTAPAGSC